MEEVLRRCSEDISDRSIGAEYRGSERRGISERRRKPEDIGANGVESECGKGVDHMIVTVRDSTPLLWPSPRRPK